MLFVLLTGITVCASPQLEPIVGIGKTSPSEKELNPEQIILNSNIERVHTRANSMPSLCINSIVLQPRYTIPGDPNIYIGLYTYTVKQPTVGGYRQGLLMKITPAIQTALENAVSSKGYTLIGYRYDVNISYSGGGIINGRMEFDEPHNMADDPVATWAPPKTYIVRTDLANPTLNLNGRFMFNYGGKETGLQFSAASYYHE